MAGIPNGSVAPHHTLLLLMDSGPWALLMGKAEASGGPYLPCSQALVVGAQAREPVAVGNRAVWEPGPR